MKTEDSAKTKIIEFSLSPRRTAFEKAKWEMGDDGLPENPMADPNCGACRGHGIVDAGDMCCSLQNCSKCWMWTPEGVQLPLEGV